MEGGLRGRGIYKEQPFRKEAFMLREIGGDDAQKWRHFDINFEVPEGRFVHCSDDIACRVN